MTKKYIQFSDDQVKRVSNTFHQWQSKEGTYHNDPEYSYSAKTEEVIEKDFFLVPSKYIEFINRDEEFD